MTDRKLMAAAQILGQMISGISATNEGLSADLQSDTETSRVWAEITVDTGDVYEISARWLSEKSP